MDLSSVDISKLADNSVKLIELLRRTEEEMIFELVSHTYCVKESGEVLKPVTSFCSSFKMDFDSDYWSDYVAKRDGKTQEAVLEEWKIKSKTALFRGSLLHELIEHYLLELKSAVEELPSYIECPSEFRKEAFDKFEVFKIWWRKINPDGEMKVVFSEGRMYSTELGLAGTADLFIELRGELFIFDWKTNEKFKTENKYQKLLPPFDAYQETDLSFYSVQLSTYKAILNSYGINIKGMVIVSIPTDGEIQSFNAFDFSTQLTQILTQK